MVTHLTGKKTEARLPKTIQLVGSGAENNFLIQKLMIFPLRFCVFVCLFGGKILKLLKSKKNNNYSPSYHLELILTNIWRWVLQIFTTTLSFCLKLIWAVTKNLK